MKNIYKNPVCSFSEVSKAPKIDDSAYIHPMAVVVGDVHIGKSVMVAPFASIRCDEGTPFYIGDGSNVQDGVVFHALETFGEHLEANTFDVGGERYAIFVGKNVSLAHQCQLHGPVVIEDETFVGMQSFVFRSQVGKGCVIEPGAKVIGVNIESGRYVAAGRIIDTQKLADGLPEITDDYPNRNLNAGVVEVNAELASAYNKDKVL